MAEATLTFDDLEVRRFIEALINSMRDVSAELKTAADQAGFPDIISHFRDERGPDGAWQPRSQMTNMIYDLISAGKRKAPKGIAAGAFSSSNKLLQLTGSLRQSVLPARKRDNLSVMLVANKEYARIHDKGGQTRFGMIPARPFMWLSDNAMEKMAQIFLGLMLNKADN